MRDLPQRTTRRAQQDSAREATKARGGVAKRTLRNRETSAQSIRNATKKPRQKKPLPSYLHRSQADLSSDPNLQTPLLRIPNELLLQIVSYLPLESDVCFTLTCKEALRVVGTSSWTHPCMRKRVGSVNIRTEESRKYFLQLLISDTVGRLDYCGRCNILHPPLKRPSAHRPTHLTKYCFGQDAVIDYLPRDPSGVGGYNIVFEHILKAFESQPAEGLDSTSRTPIELFDGDFTIQGKRLVYRLVSSAYWVDRGLIMKHEHRIRNAQRGKALKATDVLSIPLRLCPHQSTTTDAPPASRYTTHTVPNGPMLTHAIAIVFPNQLRTGVPKLEIFRKPTATEGEQMVESDSGNDLIWRCRSCPTKFQVHHASAGSGFDDGSELVVNTWHFFGRDLYHATKYWPMFVHREGVTLGKEKRNNEFHAHTKSVPDFKVE